MTPTTAKPTYLLATLIAAVLPTISWAGNFNYNHVEGGFIDRDIGRDDDAGLRIAGMVDATPNIAIYGEYSDVGLIEQFSLGGLYHQTLQPRIDWLVGISFESIDAGRNDDSGLGLRAGFRWLAPNPRFELNPEIRHFHVFDDGNTSLRLNGLYSISPPFQLQLAIQGGDDDRFEAGARYNF